MKALFTMISSLFMSQQVLSAPIEITNGCPAFLNFEARKLHSSEKINLCSLFKEGKPMLIVNTASHCGFTGQFKGLEALFQTYKTQGLVVVGFPSNSFKQEEASETATATICYQNYGVTFPMFETVDVKGDKAHPLFAYLASKTKAPSWNFNKYLISGKDSTVQQFGSSIAPQDSKLEAAIKAAL